MAEISSVVESIIGGHEDMLDPVLIQAADAWYTSNNEGIRELIMEHVSDGSADVERSIGRELTDFERSAVTNRIAKKIAEFVIESARAF